MRCQATKRGNCTRTLKPMISYFVFLNEGKTQRIMMKNGGVKTKRYPDIKMAYVTMVSNFC